jgi:TolB protein
MVGCALDASPTTEPLAQTAARQERAELPHDACRADGACRLVQRTGRGSVQNPAFAPDGRGIVFTRFRAGYNQGAADLMLLDLAAPSTPRTIVGDGAQNVNLPGSTWSTGGLIVFSSDVDGDDRPWVVRADGTGKRKLPIGITAPAFEPSFSPDAQRLTFELAPNEEHHSIWTSSIAGGDERAITQGPMDRQPNWSPHGDRILFQRLVGHEDGDEKWAIFTMRPDGSDARRATPEAQSATNAAFSPDGSSIVYSAGVQGEDKASIFVLRLDGGSPVRVTRTALYDGAPSFSADGRAIAFESSDVDEGPTNLMWIAAP